MARPKKKVEETIEEIEGVIDEITEELEEVLDELEDLEVIAEDDTEAETDEVAAPDGLSAKEAAHKIGTDARSLRKFLRSRSGLVGQGNRWVIDPEDLAQLKIDFEAHSRPKKEVVAIVMQDDDDDEIEDLDFTDED